ncbi:hypothetical protein WMY93_022340 [Mugilogobius chulae]|uniref:Ig-like domain-containing protein n=1 Tax=Mugilogobius chulae TaxID=88201 RepID=A0AAW0N7V6_9GOBI
MNSSLRNVPALPEKLPHSPNVNQMSATTALKAKRSSARLIIQQSNGTRLILSAQSSPDSSSSLGSSSSLKNFKSESKRDKSKSKRDKSESKRDKSKSKRNQVRSQRETSPESKRDKSRIKERQVRNQKRDKSESKERQVRVKERQVRVKERQVPVKERQVPVKERQVRVKVRQVRVRETSPSQRETSPSQRETSGVLSRIVSVPRGPLIRVEGQSISIHCDVVDYSGPDEQHISNIISTIREKEARDEKIKKKRVGGKDIKIKRERGKEKRERQRNVQVKFSPPLYIFVLIKTMIPNTLKVSPAVPPPVVSESGDIVLSCNVTRELTQPTYLSVTWSIRKSKTLETEEILSFGPQGEVSTGPQYTRRYHIYPSTHAGTTFYPSTHAGTTFISDPSTHAGTTFTPVHTQYTRRYYIYPSTHAGTTFTPVHTQYTRRYHIYTSTHAGTTFTLVHTQYTRRYHIYPSTHAGTTFTPVHTQVPHLPQYTRRYYIYPSTHAGTTFTPVHTQVPHLPQYTRRYHIYPSTHADTQTAACVLVPGRNGVFELVLSKVTTSDDGDVRLHRDRVEPRGQRTVAADRREHQRDGTSHRHAIMEDRARLALGFVP